MKKELQNPQENVLWLKGAGYEISISKKAEVLKQELLTLAKDIGKVENPVEAGIAKQHRDGINKILIEVEKCRKQVKQPVIDKGKEIDRIADEFTKPLDTEKGRLDGMIGAFAMAQEKIRREAAERAMREAEKAAELQHQQDETDARAERLRIGLEQAEAEGETPTAESLQEIEQLEVKSMDLSHAAGVSGMQAHAASMVVYDNPKVKGASVGLDYEVADVHALYAFNRMFVELTPKRREILRLLATNQELGLKTVIPGLLIKEVARVR